MTQPTVGVCTPCKDERVDRDYTVSLASMTAMTVKAGLLINNHGLFRDIALRKHTTHIARNWLVRYMLAKPEPKVTHLFWVDDDHDFPPDSILRLLAHDKDIVGCLHRLKAPPYTIIGKLSDPSADMALYMGGGLHRADYLGGAFLMVKRRVYETLAGPWYKETNDPALAGTDTINPDNVDGDISEDVYFCREATKAGFEIWADLDLTYEVSHKNGSEKIMFRNPPPLPPYPLATDY